MKNFIFISTLAVLCVATLPISAAEPAPRTFTITNNSPLTAQVYLNSTGYSYVSKGSGGNLAYDQTGKLDPEGETRLLTPGQSTTYRFTEGARMAFCVSVMVKFLDQNSYSKAIAKNNTYKGCANQNILLTREDDQGNPSLTGSAVATFNYTAPVDPKDEPKPVDPNAPAPKPDPNAAPPVTKESVLDKIQASQGAVQVPR